MVHVHQDTAQQMKQLSLVPLVHVTFSKHDFGVMKIASNLGILNRYLPKKVENIILYNQKLKTLKIR